jgi:hypothetical protein
MVVWALFACGSGTTEEPSDTATDTVLEADPAEGTDPADDPIEEDDDLGCTELVADYVGPEQPRVGDSWEVWLRCDGATMVGSTIVRPDPIDMATVYDNEVTFLYPVEGSIKIQSGSFVAYLDVVVSE